jgi:MFS family permease
MKSEAKIFYGWWIILVSAVGLFMGYGAIISFTFSVFAKPIAQEFNWSRTEVSSAYSISLIVYCAATPLVGRLVDRYGARKVILASVVLFGLCLLSLYLLGGSLWHFYSIYILMGIVGGGCSLVPYSGVISHWFDKRRGLALGLAAIGAGASTFVMPSLASFLITVAGWRGAYLIIGLMVILITLPVVGFFLVERPNKMGLMPDGDERGMTGNSDAHQVAGATTGEALRSFNFWLLFTAFFLVGISIVGILIHLVPLLTDMGISPQSAAFATSVLGGAVILGRIISGYLLDRIFASYVAFLFLSGATLGVLLLWSGITGGTVFIATFLIGLGMGAENDVIAYLVSRYFGLRSYGEVYGYALMSFALGGVVGPVLMGIGFDRTGSYRFVLGLFIIILMMGALLMTRLGPYRAWKIEKEVAPV